jgi:quinol---cytochrome-c reductase cytochrome c subunit
MKGSRLLALAVLSLVPTAAIQLLGTGGRRASAQAEEEVDRGLELYVAGCASCHGVTGEGTGQGPTLVGVGSASVDFMLSTGRMPLANPQEQPSRGPPRYSPEEIAALVAFVTSLGPGGPAIPAVSRGGGDLAEGRELYVANCLACHGAAAQGASVGGGAVAPALDQATAVQITEAVRIGPGMMPLFGEQQIDDRDMDSLIRYVRSLRDPDDRGGLGLGHVGPVVEGLIGWLLGLGVLLLVVRLTGTAT